MYDGKYVPTEEDMKRYEALRKSGKKFSEYTDDEISFMFKVFEYLNFMRQPSPEEIDEGIETGAISVDGPYINGVSPFERHCEMSGYYDRHPEKRPSYDA